MNARIGIIRDEGIVKVEGPSKATVDKFAEDGDSEARPSLRPMRLCFEVPYKHPWNEELCELLLDDICAHNGISDEDDIDVLYTLFCQRFTILRTIANRHEPRHGEDETQVAKRVVQKKQATLKNQRKNSRRNTVSMYESR